MNCRFCDNELKKDKTHTFGRVPMTPNAIEYGLLLVDGKSIEYELTISVCENCGLIQQFFSPDPSVLYFQFKNEIVGELWDRHYSLFTDFIIERTNKKSKILEIGGGDHSLAEKLLSQGIDEINVIEKNIKSKSVPKKIKLFKGFLEEYQSDSSFDIIYSSHVLEHIDDIQNHLKKISSLLSSNGRLIFSLPDFKKWIQCSATNAFNQEHPIYPTIENLSNLLEFHGFKIDRIFKFEDHSLFIDAIYLNVSGSKKIFCNKSQYENNFKIVATFFKNFNELGKNLREFIGNSEIYIFGANSGTQLILKNFLNDVKIISILDNSNLKNGKLLYGFNYIVEKPAILKNIKNIERKKLILCTGQYVKEIKNQIININNKIQIFTNQD